MIETIRRPKPHWLKVEPPSGKRFFKIKRDLKERNLFTICQSARCPNVAECWNNLNATFLIMGDICTRNCLFCSVENGPPDSLDCDEAGKILEVIELLESKYIVITSVTRDDLEDYGSSHFASIIKQLKKNSLDLKIEVLIPDFKGNIDFIEKVIKARPDVISHNLETVKNLYPEVNRNRNNYYVSLRDNRGN